MAARRHSPGRWLAPLALVACAVAVYTVVHNGLKDDTSSKATSTIEHSGTTSTTKAKDGKSAAKRRRFYTVQSGDTLSAIALKTGVSLATIQRLNPKLDAQSLRTGQKIKLAP
jgi:LysM repeat protein